MEKDDCSLGTWKSGALGGLAASGAGLLLARPGRQKPWGDLSGVCELGFWGEVKPISSSGWMASKEQIPLH